MNSRITISMPDPVRKIIDRLKAHGYEAFIVGGCVRDALLGRMPEDWDITTSALPNQVKSLFHNTADTGISHGTVMVIEEKQGYEVTTYRVDGDYLDGRHPSQVTFTRSLEEDLKRRDFTINALAYGDGNVVDLFDGLKDMENRVIRCVGNPGERFREDALRIMRAVRFSAQLCFSIESGTKEAISRYAGRLKDISMERIRVEWEKTLLSEHPESVQLFRELGMAPHIIKEYSEKCFDPEKTGLYHKTRVKELRLAAFFENLTPEEADKALRNLRYDNKTRETTVAILRHLDMPLPENRLQVKQSLHQLGIRTFQNVLEYRKIRFPSEAGFLSEIEKLTQDITEAEEAWDLSQLALTGSDLIAAGIPSGKKIGEILEKILQKVMQSPTLNTREQLCNKDFLLEVENECSSGL